MTAPWWRGLTAASAPIACGDDEHRIAWVDGDVRALDHADVEGDRTLAALGGDEHACLVALDTWQRHHDDLRLLLYGSRGPSDRVQVPDEPNGRRSPSGWFTTAPNAGVIWSPSGGGRSRRVYATGGGAGAPPNRDPDDVVGVVRLLSFGGGLSRRLTASVAATWADRLDAGDEQASGRRSELQAALHGRGVAAVREWLDDQAAVVEVVMSDGERTITRTDDGYRLTVPFRWLVDVWAHDLATVAGSFCLATSGDTDRRELRVVDTDLSSRTVVITTA